MEKKLNIREFLKKQIHVSQWYNERDHPHSRDELIQLCDMAIKVLQNEPTLAVMSPPCTVVGDIHGQYHDLIRILTSPKISRANKNKKEDGMSERDKKKPRAFSTDKFVFLGDYVDRGSHSLECIVLVLSLKIFFPSRYVLLRGNHETRNINFAYGFREEVATKLAGPGDFEKNTAIAMEVWEKFNEVFSYLPLACVIGHKILCMHGGISPELHSLDNIREIKTPLADVSTSKLAQDLLWADPIDEVKFDTFKQETSYMPNKIRGLSVTFNEKAVFDTLNRLDIKMIVRAHQMVPEGYRLFAKSTCITIFSAARYMNETNNKGSTLYVGTNGQVHISTFKSSKGVSEKPQEDEITRCDENVERSSTKKGGHVTTPGKAITPTYTSSSSKSEGK